MLEFKERRRLGTPGMVIFSTAPLPPVKPGGADGVSSACIGTRGTNWMREMMVVDAGQVSSGRRV